MTNVPEYADPRLAALYDRLNPFAADTAFYLDLAAGPYAASVADIGCGTGLLACELARRGHRVTGVDPARAMLDVARGRPYGERVRWVEGDASRLGAGDADLAVMTGHVAQVFLDEESWRAVLAAAYRALRPGGRLAFEGRDPDVRPWALWTPGDSRRTVDGGRVEVWHRLTDVGGGRVRFDTHYRFTSTGEELVSAGELRFRTRAELAGSLEEAGFAVERVYGDWDRRPAGAGRPELIFVAVRP